MKSLLPVIRAVNKCTPSDLWIEFPSLQKYLHMLSAPPEATETFTEADEKTSVNNSVKTSVKILELLLENPEMTLAEAANSVGRTARAVELTGSKDSIFFPGLWEQIHNPNFNSLEFEGIKIEAERNSFSKGGIHKYSVIRKFRNTAAGIAKRFAENEFEKYLVIQDRLFESDFDRAIKQLTKTDGRA